MPLRIRCPHCQHVLVAEDEAAGEARPCPACNRLFSVPLPRSAITEQTVPALTFPACPRCHAELPVTATYCYRCHTDLRTGQRLPLKARLRLRTWRFWLSIGFAAAATLLVAFTAIQVYRIRSRPAGAAFNPIAPQAVPAAEFAARLLAADTMSERAKVLQALGAGGQRVAPAVADALATSLAGSRADTQLRWNQIAAIDVLARSGQAHAESIPDWLGLLERCQQQPELSDAALRARALLGDPRAADLLSALWLDQTQRQLLLARIIRAAHAGEQAGAALVLHRSEIDLKHSAEGLRALAQHGSSPIFDRLAGAWWASWDWLGQGRGDRLADEIFELARTGAETLEFKPEDVRQPRDVMIRITDRAPPAARAAAGLILEQRGPQYRTASRSIGDTLGGLLAQCDPLDQQRLTWAISRLQGRRFGSQIPASPLDITAAEISAALAWAHAGQAGAVKEPLVAPPRLTYRAVTAARQAERDLLADLQRGWNTLPQTLAGWRAADLGCTPRIRALLSPGQRRPDYPTLAAALVIAAESDEQSLRPQVELWREATDQPAWVRALAYTVLGRFDAHRERWDSGWPAGLELSEISRLDAGQPGWDLFGRVLAAGGPAMIARLSASTPAPLSPAIRTRLLEAAKQITDRMPARDVSR